MQFLLCNIGKENFAIDAMLVQKITEIMPVTKLPYVATYVDGLINVDGDVIVQLNLPRLLNIKTQANGELIVIHVNNYHMALVVDKAVEQIIVTDDDINTFDSNISQNTVIHSNTVAVDIDYISAEIRNNDCSYLILNLEKLVDLIKPQEVAEGEQGFLSRNRSTIVDQAEEVINCLTFSIGAEMFALPLLKVSEIVDIPAFTQIPGAPGNIVGIAPLRGQPILVLSAASLFNLAEHSFSQAISKVVIVPYKEGVIGLLIDKILGIKSYTESELKKEESTESLVEAYIIDSNQQVILLMNIEAMFASDSFRVIENFRPKVKAQTAMKKITTIKLLKILLANELCAIPVEHVVRLSEYQNTATIQDNEKGIVGTVDLDGQIIPLVNINKRLNIRNDENFSKLVIIELQKQQWALCINDAQLLFDLDVELIEHSSQRKTVRGIASYKGELISILDFNWLLTSTV